MSERLAWLQGRRVEVHVIYADVGQLAREQFEAVFEDVLPMGREYFFVLRIGDARRLVRTSSVASVAEIPSPTPDSREQP